MLPASGAVPEDDCAELALAIARGEIGEAEVAVLMCRWARVLSVGSGGNADLAQNSLKARISRNTSVVAESFILADLIAPARIGIGRWQAGHARRSCSPVRRVVSTRAP